VGGLTIHQLKDYGRLVAPRLPVGSPASRPLRALPTATEEAERDRALLTTTSREGADYGFAAYAEVRRREPVAYNGTILHEPYLGNVGPPGVGRAKAG